MTPAVEPNPTAPPEAGPRPRRRWWPFAALAGVLVLVVLGVLGRHWLWLTIRAQAQARGIQLDGCELQIGWQRITLRDCRFASSRDASAPGDGWLLGSARSSGRIDELEVSLASFRAERVRVRGAEVAVRGELPWLDLLRSVRSNEAAAPGLQIDVQNSSLTWISGDATNPWVALSALEYHSGTEQAAAELAAAGMQGHLSLQQGDLLVTLGDSERPKVRLSLHPNASDKTVGLGLDLQALPLAELEGRWLVLSDALRSVKVDGRIAVSLPFGLVADSPAGDVYLTLSGLQFPVPREVEGLVHSSAPRISGKLSLNHALDHASVRNLQFQTGALNMQGSAQLELAGEGAAIRANLSGPLSCVSIAESAARAHAGSLLAQWAKTVARRALRGSVQIAAALQAHTSDLPHAQVMTSIGVGCGLQPLPVVTDLPRDLLERLPEDIRRRLPRLDALPKLPKLPTPPGIPDTLQLPPLPGLKQGPTRGREPSASG